MMGAYASDTDPYQIDPLAYLATLNDDLTPTDCLEHYHVLKPALLRVQSEDLAAFDLALQEVSKRLKIKAKTVKADLAALVEPPAAKEAKELLEQMGQTRPLRFAQDFMDNTLWYGVIAGEQKLLLNSDRALLKLDRIPKGVTVRDNGFDLCRLSKDAILRFLSGGTATGYELLADLRGFFTRFAVFRDPRIASLLAAWTLGTYCYRVFRVFPYLALRSPDKRCGKSRVLDLLSLLAFNASLRLVHATEAQIFRAPSRNGGALLLDEVEALKNTDKENFAGLLSVLNSGFEQGGSVSRMQKNGTGDFTEVSFETYCPRALAGINKLADTLEDRSLIITMQRKLAREKTERFSPTRLEEEAQVLRDRCYLWALTHAVDLAAVYNQADSTFPALAPLDDRARDLWEPVICLVALADVEQGNGRKALTEELTALALDLSQARDSGADDSTTVQVIGALREVVAEKRTDIVIPTALAGLLKEKLGWEKLTTRTLASLLNPLGLYSRGTRLGEKIARAYHLSTQQLTELSERYARNDTAEE